MSCGIRSLKSYMSCALTAVTIADFKNKLGYSACGF